MILQEVEIRQYGNAAGRGTFVSCWGYIGMVLQNISMILQKVGLHCIRRYRVSQNKVYLMHRILSRIHTKSNKL